MLPHRAREFLARAVVGLLFVLLARNLLNNFLVTHQVTGLLLLLNESAVVVLTVLRRPTMIVDRSPLAAGVTVVSVIGPVLLRANDAPGLVPDAATALLSIAGLIVGLAGKATLGRSFGLVPANRGVVAQGPYLIVRHPIYAGYLITHVAFLLAHPTPYNIGLAVVADSALVIRALLEERVLAQDEQYRTYCGQVSWHLVPGVF